MFAGCCHAPAAASKAATPACPGHPLDPLTGAEIAAAAAACKQLAEQQSFKSLRFNVVTLKEPPKATLLSFEAGHGLKPPRQVFAILQVRKNVLRV